MISLIVAVSDNHVIGKDNALPWHLSADLRHFKQQTLGKPIIMGRKTWQSIGKALPGRRNIVMSRDGRFDAQGAEVVDSLASAVALAGDAPEIMIIGGAAVYADAMPLAQRVLLTRVHVTVDDGDAFFPALDDAEWRSTCQHHLAGEQGQPACTFFVYERR